MHSSISMSLEPGLDRGVPWGRDLYTFVTSAAGHMMRTLQKPRKNRPSKRQVNHRRFLHNMIQRKFADIEAANHRLASALYFKDDAKKPNTPEQEDSAFQSNSKTPANIDTVLKSKDCIAIDSHDTEMGEKKQTEVQHLWKQHPKSRKNKHTQKRTHQNLPEFTTKAPTCINQEALHFQADMHFSMDPQTDVTESSVLQFDRDVDNSPPFSPDLSPLSLDSCDLSVQMFTDISSCTPAQKSFADITESQWADIIDLFSSGQGLSKDFRTSTNVEAYFESICECHSDAEGRVGTDDELEDFFYERGQCKYDLSQNQEAAPNNLVSENISSMLTSLNENDMHVNHFASSNNSELPSSLKYQCMSYQPPLQQSQCMQYEPNPIPFEGVAQSFSAPSQNVPRCCSIATPPHEGDWLFTDILTDTD